MSVLALDQADELRALVGVHRTPGLLVEGAVDGLRTDDLRGRGHQRRQACGQAHRGDQLHGARQDVLGLELLELGDHVRVHAAGYLGLLHQFVGSRETEIGLDLAAGVDRAVLIVGLGGRDGLVEQSVDLGGQLVSQRVECLGFGFVRTEHRLVELLADLAQLGVDLGHGLHVHAGVDTQFAAEHVDQLDGRGTRAFGEIPAVGIDDVDAGHDGREHRSQAVAGGTVGMEIDRNRDVLLEQLDQRGDTARRDQARHVLDGNHVGAQCGHLFGLVEEIGIREDGLRLFPAHQALHEGGFGIFRVDRITYGAVGDAAVLLDVFDRRFHVVHVVQGIEDTHDAQPAFDRVAAEAVDHVVGVRRVAEQVTAARKRRELRHLAHSLVDRLQARPRVLVEITHHRVGYGTAPDLHRIEICILVEGQATVYLCLRHARRERGLLSVAQRKVSDFEISRHCDIFD